MNNVDKTKEDLIYLLHCATNNKIPEKEKVDVTNLDNLYTLSKYHSLSAIVGSMLETIGIKNENFIQDLNKSIRKNILFDIERKSILDEFEKEKIWYMPLKGIIIKDLYPKNGMREMSDNDIFYDKTRQKDVEKIMNNKGYSTEKLCVDSEYSNADVYMKKPTLNFEFHITLFEKECKDSLYEYYDNIQKLMIKDENNDYGYHLSDEDFYIYMTAHEYKHICFGGTGIRSLLDCYVYLNAKRNMMNWDYINNELKKLDIDEYEKKRRKLSEKIFSSGNLNNLTKEEEEILQNHFQSGTYGIFNVGIKNRMEKYFSDNKNTSKFSYIIKRIFPDFKFMVANYNFLNKYKFLLPVIYIWRIIKAILKKPKTLLFEIKEVKKYDNK